MIQTCFRPRLSVPGQDERDFFDVLGTGRQQALFLYLGDSPVSRIAMAVQLFGVREAAFYGFFSSFVDPFPFRCEALVVDLFFMDFPYVAGDDFHMVAALCAVLEPGALSAD